ncbi:Z1 domain-containing protein [Alcanivorax sp. IL3]|uniref:Z1 domain-containing protein n=1 Tax=unclassified Alcanivorax TaxID=2638842 RepID=UPI0023553D5B|tara:strand:+ start:1124 stop:3802 length:2679 start_codon:yes stop_codon:yes gene_type:complete
MGDIKILRDMVVASIGNGAVDLDELAALATKIGKVMSYADDEIQDAIKQIQAGMDVSMEEGAALLAADHVKWVENSRSDIAWQYWERYEQYLLKNGYPKPVVNKIAKISERILDSAGDPRRKGAWARKGMVIGDVQSGKTANYTAVLSRAVDAGYKVIVVIAGIHNNLRSQTQARIDEGLSGLDSTLALLKKPTSVGVGKIRRITPSMVSLTNTESDFNTTSIKSVAGAPLTGFAGPVVFVIKKNKWTLTRLIEWLKAHNADKSGIIRSAPMMLIDDEADNASINTSSDPDRSTTINALIRQLLQLFDQRVYVGYTATPFANIFIDHDSFNDEEGDDLFPSHFIHSLEAPSNYMGAEEYFAEPKRKLIFIDDMEAVLPLKHKNHAEFNGMPETLEKAILLFVLVRAIRLIRGDKSSHNSMLVNVSRFTSVQKNVGDAIFSKLDEFRKDIRLSFKLPTKDALQSKTIRALKDVFDSEYEHIEENWSDVQLILNDAVSPISVVTVNSASSEGLNYPDYEEGRNVIAVGGFSLSRGLTLEGLSISYFYRNSIMYDTLLQMARWFGYRPNYNDLCRVFISEDAADWYEHISEASKELRQEVRRMEANNLTPEQFGLRVRRHPDSLIVTARNKMQKAEKFTQAITLSSQLIETHLLKVDKDTISWNRDLVIDLLNEAKDRLVSPNDIYTPKGNFFYKKVPYSLIRKFLGGFRYHENCLRVQKGPLLSYIEGGKSLELEEWDIVVTSGRSDDIFSPLQTHSINLRERVIGDQHEPGKSATVGNKFRVGQATDEAAGLTIALYEEIKNNADKSPSGKDFRAHRERPLLIVHPINLFDRKPAEGEFPAYNNVIAFGISFPAAQGREPKAEEYMVNTVWWRDFLHAEEDEDDENPDSNKEA